ncbi:TetR/AcrR family transcriptional regulator C-terminal domain-containing protein [Streptomyces sp. JB150]|uniref:TetR/AcrR family transcriptional regulator n=1 Tax=Streptomyces sp. JB150 TaxID=2714844 RepID=UPI00140DFD6C|nr:TetR/AcrR family transcriptional regulator C-terminal domain-containing protein [Streptomyces sp. JB150]QIJ60972.1 TetR family transcriptional regulator [Streptomyces sp. JB150]
MAGEREGPRGGVQGRRASDRGRYGRLNRERVLASALEIVDRDGLSGLSMRRLGAELGVEAMALYRYASGKDALLDGLVEAFCLELERELGEGAGEREGLGLGAREGIESRRGAGAGERAGDWRGGLHRIARTAHRVALRHPNVVPLLATRLLSTPLARRPAAVLRSDERILALLSDAGMSDRQAVAVHRSFTAWLLGYLLVELRAMDDVPEEPDPAFRIGLHRISAQELPRLRATALALAGPAGPEALAAGLDALLDRFT